MLYRSAMKAMPRLIFKIKKSFYLIIFHIGSTIVPTSVILPIPIEEHFLFFQDIICCVKSVGAFWPYH